MPYFPKTGRAYRGSLPYFCERCGKWYQATEKQCKVVHAKGLCCHTGEIQTESHPTDPLPPTKDEELCPTFQ